MVMGSKLLLFISYILIHLVGLTIAQFSFLEQYCINSSNYTLNSTYQTNLDTLLSSISSNTNVRNGFYNLSVGQNPHTVNAIALCRGDVDPDSCRVCLDDSRRTLRQSCPNQMEAIGWSDNCMLRYSNRSIFHVAEFLPNAYVYNINNSSSVAQFNQVVRTLLDSLSGEAARGGSLCKFATGNLSGPDNLSIYGLVQCTPDLSSQECNRCLSGALDVLPQCCDGRIGGRGLRPSCHFRYEIERFYNETLTDALPPATDAPSPATDSPSPAAGAPSPPATDSPSPAAGAPSPATDVPSPATDAPSPATDLPSPAAGAPSPATDAPSPATDSPSPAAGAPSPATDAPSPAAGAPSPATDVPSPATDSPSPAAGAPSPATDSPPPAADAPPPPNSQPALPSGKGGMKEVALVTVSTLMAAAMAIMFL